MASDVDSKWFTVGMRVYWRGFRGVTGTVTAVPQSTRCVVKWDDHCAAWAPTTRGDIFDIFPWTDPADTE